MVQKKHPEGTYVRYIAYNPDGEPLDKISYVKVYKPLDILIGSGVYLNYLDKDLLAIQKKQEELLKSLLKNIIIVSLISLIVIVSLVYFFAKKVQKRFINYENELQTEKEKFKKKAKFDDLTGFYTRYGGIEEFRKMKKVSKNIAILFVDLDQFKEINDSLGHTVGDEVLKVISQRIKACVGESGRVIRFGGDEFIVLINNIDDKKIENIVQNILLNIKKRLKISGMELFVSASIGIVMYPEHGEDFYSLIRLADSAMYKAKALGKDRYIFYKEEISKEVDKKLKIKNELIKAFENNEFKIYLQPQIDKNGNLYGAEVLIRWQHPTLGLLPPSYFLPVAIESGLVNKIDLWVIEEAIKQHLKWQEKGYNIVLSCNITVKQLENDDFINDLKKLLKKYNFNPKYLNIEITEDCIMHDSELAIKILNKLKNLGVGIDIDDFGTGYSSLLYLKKMPLDKLKIDREFIKDIPEDKDDEIITKTIINLAKNLQLEVVAEGVEKEKQKEFVIDNDCDYIQGYYYSPPISVEEFEEKFLKGFNGS